MLPRLIVWTAFRGASALRVWLGRRFTRAGLLVLAGAFGAAVTGIDTTRTMAFQAFTFLFVLLVVAVGWGGVFRAAVEMRRELGPYASVGEPFVYRMTVRNRGSRRLAGLVVIEDLVDPRPPLREFLRRGPGDGRSRAPAMRWRRLVEARQVTEIAEHAVPAILPGRSGDVRMETTPRRRGRLTWTGATFARSDPFGLFRGLVSVPSEQSILVLPRRYPVAPVRLPGARKYQPGGVALASSVGDSEEFVALRDYRPGDSTRRIHWKSWARAGHPVVREYQEEFFVRHALVLDTFTGGGDVFEEAVSVAASFACALEAPESLLDLMFVGPEAFVFTAGRGVGHQTRMLEILAAVEPCRDRSFGDLHRLVAERASALSGCLCVLVAWDDERRRFLDELTALGVPTLTLVIAPPGAALGGRRPRAGLRWYRLEPGRIAEGLAAL